MIDQSKFGRSRAGKRIAVGLTLVALASGFAACMTPAYAGCGADRCVGEKIARIYIRPNGEIWIDTTGNEQDLTCAPIENKYLSLPKDHLNFDAIFSTFLSAKLTDQVMAVIKTNMDTTDPCSIVYVVLD